MHENYYINEYGIYTEQSCYGDDTEAVYHVKFNQKDTELKDRAFARFCRQLRKEGADEKMNAVKEEFKNLFEFMG